MIVDEWIVYKKFSCSPDVTIRASAMFRLRRNLPRKLCFLERPAGREILCLHKDQEGRRSSPVGCCVVGNPIKGFPDAASYAAFVQRALCKPVFRHAKSRGPRTRSPACFLLIFAFNKLFDKVIHHGGLSRLQVINFYRRCIVQTKQIIRSCMQGQGQPYNDVAVG